MLINIRYDVKETPNNEVWSPTWSLFHESLIIINSLFVKHWQQKGQLIDEWWQSMCALILDPYAAVKKKETQMTIYCERGGSEHENLTLCSDG